MAGRMSSGLQVLVGAFCRGWLFGVVLGLVVGGGLGTVFIPVVGTVYGAMVGVPLGAITGLAAALLVAPAALLPRSVLADRVWPGLVSAGLTFLLVTRVVFSGGDLWSDDDGPYFLALVLVTGAMGVLFGAAVTRRARVRFMQSVGSAVYGSILGAMVSAGYVLREEGLGEPGFLAGFTFMGWVAGGILGAALVIFNLLVTKEPSAE